MTYVVRFYDTRGFMFAYKAFNTKPEAERYAAVFKRNKATVVRVVQ